MGESTFYDYEIVAIDGRLLKRYAPTVKPRDNGLMQDIADAL